LTITAKNGRATGSQLDEQLAIDTIRTLSIDAVQAANSGHPGAPMGMAPMAYVLWTRFLRHSPTQPSWPDRDRFVLSAGHASMLLYSLLYLTGYDLSLDEIRHFRQYGSRTPGHPEFGLTPGVEATTGPLGQGFANAVGMAMAERRLAAEFDRPGHQIVDHRTYCICSDGDLQEGITAEAASLAGHLRLGRLIVLYDDNQVQLDGPTAWAWSEDVLGRFDAYGWHTARVEDGNDTEAIAAAVGAARDDPRPSLIAVRTVIGYGSPNRAGTQKAHGQPLGADEVRLTKQAYGWDPDLDFHVPEDALGHFRRAVPHGEELVAEWQARFERYAAEYPAEANELRRRLAGRLPPAWADELPAYDAGTELATRNASQNALQVLGRSLPELIGGAADLSESNLTDIRGEPDFSADEAGRNIRFGVREHAMGGIGNGLAYHGGLIPYLGTFLNFSDYMRGAVRAEADSGAIPDLILIATGSELQLAVSARVELESEGIRVRVVSLPCWELFAAQPQAYRDEVLPPDIGKRVSIEAGVAQGWERWVGPDGAMICVERFGASAPGVHIFAQFGFSAEHVCEVARGVLTGKLRGVVAPVPDHVAPGDPT